jgi:carotene isomerase
MDTDVVVIGSGIGGLCCAAMLARYGFDVTVCESHTIPGGAAHAFERDGFKFDSGPSLYSGLSYSPSSSPLRQVLDAIGEDLEWKTYDVWGCHLPEGSFNNPIGTDQFDQVLEAFQGSQAVEEWHHLKQVMAPLAEAAIAIPPAAFRADLGAVRTLGRFLPAMLRQTQYIRQLTGPFSRILEREIHDPFIHRWMDMLCFLLSGLPANGTIAAEMAFMFAEWYRPHSVLDYPVGGAGAFVDTLVRGLEKHGGKLLLGTPVEQIVVKNKRAAGVRLRSGQTLQAKRAVISNASIWDTLKLLPKGSIPQRFIHQRQATPACESFMHLHLGIDAAGLPDDLECHYIVVKDWDLGITAPQNIVLISIPSVLDPSLAPPGKHVIHAYTPGNEPFEVWQELDRRSEAYAQQKQERAEILWTALERVVPNIRDRAQLTLVGTPLTHARFLRRHHGSYGPAIPAGQAIFPGPRTPLSGLLCCGDSTFPGIGLPAVAASGMIAANTLATVPQHLQMLKDIGCLS